MRLASYFPPTDFLIRRLDLFALTEDRKTVKVFLWNKGERDLAIPQLRLIPDSFSYKPSHALSLSSPIVNVIPGDYDHDGKLDLLVMSEDSEKGGWWPGHKEVKTRMAVYFGGGPSGSFRELAGSTLLSLS